MKGGGTRPRFFCEHCGEEVPRNARVCPHCGRFFVHVRCPRCGFVGAEDLFKEGCPVCGYSALPINEKRRGKGWLPFVRSYTFGSEGPEPLPWWVYGLTVALLLISLTIFFCTLF
ncbi:MAG: zinc ribbon domain-containing protein [Treponemataceae bacterium]|uniref:zinc ribbon domain-containing protein n=1 Tax=Treponema sp. J25 TaxID=2094121 RepID=UPI00104D6B86|nr:zinc ribbon domain-containing protein [Treponema sp. J25]MCX7949169.1 zinc ribbon domain-containing protein [Treponemataceae bacterium]TCW62532.1 hypothetical protein C5O22_00295 [Treponema sp. J25]HOM23566.1 zinc ribbon domain-containing protein [Termitinemataceae bacterium]HPP99853.1 zinc ribbon domain-containing protein [Termitinemataceae bacterium]